MSPQRVEAILFALVLITLPITAGTHFWPNFAFVYLKPLEFLSPAIFVWDILVVLLIAAWLLSKPYVNRTSLNLLFLFLLSQILSLSSSFGPGVVKVEQLLISGLFGVYLSSKNLTNTYLRISLLTLPTLTVLVILDTLPSLLIGTDGKMNNMALNLFSSSPIFGVGLNNLISAGAENMLIGPAESLYPKLNSYPFVLSETGIVGMLGFLALIGYPILNYIKGPKLYLLIAWLLITAWMFFDNYLLFSPPGYRFFFLLWGLSVAASNKG